MPFVFVSHASEDKPQRVRPLVEALALQGVELWVDRPGHGDSHLGLDDDFIASNRIRSLRTGADYRDQIREAVKDSGAVLACLSRSLCKDRQILAQELLLGLNSNKLVACIVDDMPAADLPRNLGLIDFSYIQAPSIDTKALRKAVDHLKQAGTDAEGTLPPDCRPVWEVVRRLVRDIHFRFGTRSTAPDWSLEQVFERFLDDRRIDFVNRDWLYDGIKAWPVTYPDERMILITGASGTGKSAVAADFIGKQPCGRVLAYHCFRHDESRTLRLDGFARNLAFMLARYVRDYRKMLGQPAPQQAFQDLERSPEHGLDFIRRAIFDVLENLSRPPAMSDFPGWIVIDGLDEVESVDDRKRLVDLFYDGLPKLPTWLRVLATCHNDDTAQRLVRIELNGHPLVRQMPLDEAADGAEFCREYLEMRLSKGGRQMPDTSKRTLLERAEHNILYLKLALDSFLADTFQVEDINQLPRGLSRIYDVKFRRHYAGPSSAEFCEVAKPLLEVLAVARNPLDAKTLCATTRVAPAELQHQLRKLAAYLPAHDNKYAIFHKSFKDWLIAQDGEDVSFEYAVSAENGHALLAEHCWKCFEKNRRYIRTAISDLGPNEEWLYAMHYGIDHMLAAGWIGRPVELVAFLLDKWNDEQDGASAFKDLAPRRFTREVLRAFDDDHEDDEKCKVNPSKLAGLLTDFYQIEPLEAPLTFLIERHPGQWPSLQDQFLHADNYVLRYAMSHVLAQICTEQDAPVNIDQVHSYLERPDINYRELGAYTLRHLYSRNDKLIRTEYLERMGDSETYPARTALGDLLLNLAFQKRFDCGRITSRRFWEPIWDHHRFAVWELEAARPFLAGELLPESASAGARAAYERLVRTQEDRKELLASDEVTADPVVSDVLKRFHQLGSQLELIANAEEALLRCGRLDQIMRLLFAHPLWDVAETAASVLTSCLVADRAQQSIVVALFDDPDWRVRYGAIETAFQLAYIDRMTLFEAAVRRFYGDENSMVRALCAENLISYILDGPPTTRESYVAKFQKPIGRWLGDDDCWVLEHVFRLLRKLSSDGVDCDKFFVPGMPFLLEGLPKTDWHELSREKFLKHIEDRRRKQLGLRSPGNPAWPGIWKKVFGFKNRLKPP